MGAHPDLFEEIEVAAYMSKTHFACSMRIAAVKYEEIIRGTEAARLQQEDVADIQVTAAVSSWSGGDGAAPGQPGSQSVGDVAVEIANLEDQR